MGLPSLVACGLVAVAAGMHCSEELCGYRCTKNEKCRPNRDCIGVGAACTGASASTLGDVACDFNATSANATVEWRTLADEARCRAARCATIARKSSRPPLFERYATFADELLVVTPHKGASKYIRAMFARLYGCTPRRQPGLGEIDVCDNGPGDAARRKVPWTVAAVVRDPVDRAVAMFNQFVGDGNLDRLCAKAGRNATGFSAPRLRTGAGFYRAPAALRAARFRAWIDCVGPTIRDHGHFQSGIEFRHFQPATRYAYGAEADVVGRVEHLGDLVAALAPRLPKLNASLAVAGTIAIDPWLADDARPKDRGKFDKGHDVSNLWGVHRCDLARSAEAAAIHGAIRAAYATDWTCFGGVYPASRDAPGPAANATRRRRLLGDHPTKLGCPK